MFIFFVIFSALVGCYFYYSYQIILLNDLQEIFSQTAIKAQADFKGYSELVLEDLGKSYWHILLILAFSALLSFVWIILLKYNAKAIVTVSIFSLPALLSIGLYYSITTYISLHTNDSSDILPNEQSLTFDKALQTILTEELISYVRNETLWLVVSIVLSIVLIALVIILHALKERVGLSIALIKQASKAINGVKSTLFFPIIPRAVGISILMYGVLISLLIIAASHPTHHIVGGLNDGQPCHPRLFNKSSTSIPQRKPSQATPLPNPANVLQPNQATSPPSAQVHFNGQSNNSNNRIRQHIMSSVTRNNSLPNSTLKPQCVMSQPLSRQHVWKYHAINVFVMLWIIHFISGISQTTLAGAFASYYWAYNKPRDVPFFAVTASFGRVIRFHLGDIAFGSFLIATIRYVRIVIEFIDNRIRSKGANTGADTSAARSATCFFRVFFWLLDKFLRYIDRNAYIMMSMYGESYFSSAKRAVELLYNNSTRAIVLDYVTYFVLLISRLLITAIAGLITAQEMFTANLHYKWLPIVLVVIGTYFISKGLFSVYSMAVDTLFICFLIDSTTNDGSAERPYFMSKELRRIVKRNTVMSR